MGTVLALTLLEFLGVVRVELGVPLLWRLRSHSEMESGCAPSSPDSLSRWQVA
jgi:hypothetical protein